MSIVIKVNAALSLEAVRRLYLDTDFDKPVSSDSRLATMIGQTPLVISAFDDDQLVGMARCLTDFEYFCYLSDLLVLPAYQHQGIGRQLVTTLQDYLGSRVTLSLCADAKATGFYQKLGIRSANNMYRIHRKA